MTKGGKSVSFKVPQSKLAPTADAWIANRDAEPGSDHERGATITKLKPVEASGPVSPSPEADAAPREKTARFTFDVPESLHRRIKVQCAARGIKMADLMREYLEREFPAS